MQRPIVSTAKQWQPCKSAVMPQHDHRGPRPASQARQRKTRRRRDLAQSANTGESCEREPQFQRGSIPRSHDVLQLKWTVREAMPSTWPAHPTERPKRRHLNFTMLSRPCEQEATTSNTGQSGQGDGSLQCRRRAGWQIAHCVAGAMGPKEIEAAGIAKECLSVGHGGERCKHAAARKGSKSLTNMLNES